MRPALLLDARRASPAGQSFADGHGRGRAPGVDVVFAASFGGRRCACPLTTSNGGCLQVVFQHEPIITTDAGLDGRYVHDGTRWQQDRYAGLDGRYA